MVWVRALPTSSAHQTTYGHLFYRFFVPVPLFCIYLSTISGKYAILLEKNLEEWDIMLIFAASLMTIR